MDRLRRGRRRFLVVALVLGALAAAFAPSAGAVDHASRRAALVPPVVGVPPGATTSTLAVDAGDTSVAEGGPAIDRSAEPTLTVGVDGGGAHRSFLHVDGVDALVGHDIVAARLSVWQESSATCPAAPLEVRTVRVPWAGADTTVWPGPETAAFQAVTATGPEGCGPGWVTADVSRLVERWARGLVADEGLGLLADDERDPAGLRTLSSADGGHPPVLEVVWADAGRPSHPWMPFDLADSDDGAGGPFTLAARYRDPEGDEGQVVFLTYDDRTGAYLGAYPSEVVAAGSMASVVPDLPFDTRVRWRAMSFDTVHGTTSHVSRYETATRYVIRAHVAGEGPFDGVAPVQAFLDGEVGDAQGVEFAVDGAAVGSDLEAPYFVTFSSLYFPDGWHDLTATVVGGTFDGHTSEVTLVDTDSDWWVRGPDLALSRTAAKPAVGGNRFDRRAPYDQLLRQTIAPGATRRFVLHVQNDRYGADSIRVRAVESGSPGYSVRFRAEGRDVTAAVRAETYEVGPLDRGESALVKVLVTAGVGAGPYRAVDLRGTSVLDGHAVDVVRARVDRR